MRPPVLIFRMLRKIFHQRKINTHLTDMYVQYKDQTANDYIRNLLRGYFASGKNTGLMLAKFGTTELDTFVSYRVRENRLTLKNLFAGVRGYIHIFPDLMMRQLCNNSGFFPYDLELGKKFSDLLKSDAANIDVLASYCHAERELEKELKNCVRVNLDGYYAPFMWENPWTGELKGKKILVVHPFAASINAQYKKRALLFDNPDVLPEFGKFEVIEAVQSLCGNRPEKYDTWFDALAYMESEISKRDFDVAIIGCGAYGMPLAAYVKRMGKVAIHLAGWVQMLFGIYGARWLHDQPLYAKFINENWIRPSKNERPENAETVENGCYW